MKAKRLLTIAVMLQFLAMSTVAHAGAVTSSSKAKGQKYDRAGRAMVVPSPSRNDVIHRYTAGRNTPTE